MGVRPHYLFIFVCIILVSGILIPAIVASIGLNHNLKWVFPDQVIDLFPATIRSHRGGGLQNVGRMDP